MPEALWSHVDTGGRSWPGRSASSTSDAEAPPGLGAAGKARAIRHYDECAKNYDRIVSRGFLRYLRLREREAVLHLAALEDASKRTVIDVGCGGGFYSRAAKRAGKWVHAVDAAPGMVERVLPHVDVAEVADIETYAPRRTYDVVICCGVLDFVARPETAFDNLCHLRAPGGRLVMLLPRAGPGSLIYRLEKRLHGLSVNTYRRDWIVERARRRGLELTGARHPLPYNMALLFEEPPASADAGGGPRSSAGP
jgi:SAM-dependent methyltransferase